LRSAPRLLPFAATILLVPAMVTVAAGSAQAAPASGGRAIAAAGSGAGTPVTTNLAQLAAAHPAATTDRARATDQAGANRPAGTATSTPGGRPTRTGPATTGVHPALATTVVANFDGITQNGGFGWPDVSAAASPTEIGRASV